MPRIGTSLPPNAAGSVAIAIRQDSATIQIQSLGHRARTRERCCWPWLRIAGNRAWTQHQVATRALLRVISSSSRGRSMFSNAPRASSVKNAKSHSTGPRHASSKSIQRGPSRVDRQFPLCGSPWMACSGKVSPSRLPMSSPNASLRNNRSCIGRAAIWTSSKSAMRVRSRDTLKFGSSTSIRANAWWTRRSEAPRSASSSLNVGSTSSRVHRVTTNPDSRSSSGPMPGRGAATGAPPLRGQMPPCIRGGVLQRYLGVSQPWR